jgi:hypothetical protein
MTRPRAEFAVNSSMEPAEAKAMKLWRSKRRYLQGDKAWEPAWRRRLLTR